MQSIHMTFIVVHIVMKERCLSTLLIWVNIVFCDVYVFANQKIRSRYDYTLNMYRQTLKLPHLDAPADY